MRGPVGDDGNIAPGIVPGEAGNVRILAENGPDDAVLNIKEPQTRKIPLLAPDDRIILGCLFGPPLGRLPGRG